MKIATRARRKEVVLIFGHEATRRYTKKTVLRRGLIHETRKINRLVVGLDKSSPYEERGLTFSSSPGETRIIRNYHETPG